MTHKMFSIGALVATSLAMAQTDQQVVTTTTTTTTTTVNMPISSVRKNDVMIDPFAVLAGVGSLSYEHHLNKDMGVGISTFFGESEYMIGEDTKAWYAFPYYRAYMGQRWARGFFVEGFAGVISRKYQYYEPYSGIDPGFCGDECPDKLRSGRETKFGLGFGIGGKWETKSNIIFEVSGGLGRAFGANHTYKIFGKGMLGIGYRF